MDEFNNENESEFPDSAETEIKASKIIDDNIFPGLVSTKTYSVLAERFPRLTQEKDELRIRGMESLLTSGYKSASLSDFQNSSSSNPDYWHNKLNEYNRRWLEWKEDLEAKKSHNHFLKLSFSKLLKKTNEVEKEIEMLENEKSNNEVVSRLKEMLDDLYDVLIWKRNRLDYQVSSNYVRNLLKKISR